MIKNILYLLLCFCFIGCSEKEAPESTGSQNDGSKIKVYLLGTFHFGQIGSNYDVLNAHHQQSIQELCDIIQKQRPNKVFIERQPEFEYQNNIRGFYQTYKLGGGLIERNEAWQIGFRVAKALNHPTIYQCDHPGRFGGLYEQAQNYAKANGQMPVMEHQAKGTTQPFSHTSTYDSLLYSLPLLDFLRWLNSKEVMSNSHASYVNTYPQVGYNEFGEYHKDYFVGTELTADWYRRNIYIYSKMINQLDYTEDAIFLIIGSDHVPIIQHLFASNPYFEVVEAEEWLF